MNQIKKRLSIIKLAISITDLETIQLQILKLTPIKTDTDLQEILILLQDGNYAQAQALISTYIDTAPDEVLQRTSQTTENTISKEDQQVIDEFDLFVSPDTEVSEQTVEVDMTSYQSVVPDKTNDKKINDFDTLLNLDADDVLTHTLDITPAKEKPIEIDPFFTSNHQTFNAEKIDDTTQLQDNTFFQEEIKDKDESGTPPINEISPTPLNELSSSKEYHAIANIKQDFISLQETYPPRHKSNETHESVDALLEKISLEGYNEIEIEETIRYIQTLKEEARYAEAASLVLIVGKTESKYGQFMLARELFLGVLLEKNIAQSFEYMQALAQENYPEALCDLGQFYEHGLGTPTDMLKAELFYKRALDTGIKRAKKHYSRLKKQNKKFL